jgi:hypothetical protein
VVLQNLKSATPADNGINVDDAERSRIPTRRASFCFAISIIHDTGKQPSGVAQLPENGG